MIKSLLISFSLLFLPNIVQADWNPMPPGRYIISTSNETTFMTDSMLGRSWILQLANEKNGNSYYYWRPINFIGSSGNYSISPAE